MKVTFKSISPKPDSTIFNILCHWISSTCNLLCLQHTPAKFRLKSGLYFIRSYDRASKNWILQLTLSYNLGWFKKTLEDECYMPTTAHQSPQPSFGRGSYCFHIIPWSPLSLNTVQSPRAIRTIHSGKTARILLSRNLIYVCQWCSATSESFV